MQGRVCAPKPRTARRGSVRGEQETTPPLPMTPPQERKPPNKKPCYRQALLDRTHSSGGVTLCQPVSHPPTEHGCDEPGDRCDACQRSGSHAPDLLALSVVKIGWRPEQTSRRSQRSSQFARQRCIYRTECGAGRDNLRDSPDAFSVRQIPYLLSGGRGPLDNAGDGRKMEWRSPAKCARHRASKKVADRAPNGIAAKNQARTRSAASRWK